MTFIKKVGWPRLLFNDVNENAEKKKTKTSCGFHSSQKNWTDHFLDLPVSIKLRKHKVIKSHTKA